MNDSSKVLEKVAGLVEKSLPPWVGRGFAGAAVSERNLLGRDSGILFTLAQRDQRSLGEGQPGAG
jgi:hypothetical protein